MVEITASIAIIGQFVPASSPLLAAIRAPAFLPETLNDFLFQTQWLYWIIAASLAATTYYVGRSRANARYANAGLALAGLLVLWILAASLIDTPRERLYRCHKDLAAAAISGDPAQIIAFLAPDFRSPALGIDDPQQVRDALSTRLHSYGIRSNTITAYHSDLSAGAAFTTLTLITETDIAGPVRSTWQLSWDDLPGSDWRVKEADLVKVGDEPFKPDQVLPR